MSKHRMIEYNGTVLNIKDWAKRTGLNRNTISTRLNKGWTAGEALGYETRYNEPGRPKNMKESLSCESRDNRITDEIKSNIAELYISGMKVSQIMEIFNIDNGVVYTILKKAGVKPNRQIVNKKTKGNYEKKPQPCWHCKKYAGGCSWSRDFTPVEGWTAEKVLMTSGTETYEIKECPELVSDGTEEM